MDVLCITLYMQINRQEDVMYNVGIMIKACVTAQLDQYVNEIHYDKHKSIMLA